MTLDHNKLSLLPSSLCELSRLRYLSASSNTITCLPDEIGLLPSLTQLWINDCCLTHLPESLCDLHYLEKLSVKSNNIHTLPSNLGKLKHLQWLNASDNSLQDLPASSCNLTNLTYLNLEKNQLTCVPQPVAQLTSLTILVLKHNAISSVSDDLIVELTNLAKLDLRDTEIAERPSHWRVCPRCTYVCLITRSYRCLIGLVVF